MNYHFICDRATVKWIEQSNKFNFTVLIASLSVCFTTANQRTAVIPKGMGWKNLNLNLICSPEYGYYRLFEHIYAHMNKSTAKCIYSCVCKFKHQMTITKQHCVCACGLWNAPHSNISLTHSNMVHMSVFLRCRLPS